MWAGEAECGNPPASLLFPWIWGAVGNGTGAAERGEKLSPFTCLPDLPFIRV